MQYLQLSHFKLGLDDLFEKRKADLLASAAGAYYAPRLSEGLTAIHALPPVLTGGTPLAAELDAADNQHDGYGAVLFFTAEALLRLPDGDPAHRAAAQRIREAFIPVLGELTAPYAIEASRARERRPLLQDPQLTQDLKLFALPDGRTLVDVAAAFVKAGEHLDQLLSARADAPKGTRKEAGQLRGRVLGLLSSLRKDLAEEVLKDPKLARDLEHRVFGYFDTLSDMLRQTLAAQAAGNPAPLSAVPSKPAGPPNPA